MPENVPPFTISAECRGFSQAAKRTLAASAMVLADKWADLGCHSIQITDGVGVSRGRAEFRANLPLVRRLRQSR